MLGDQVAVMHAGRIVQAGPAREVYDRPATRFVAGFIGDFNLLEPDAVGRVFGEHADCAWAIHPEAIDLLASDAGPDGLTTDATVIDVRIHGPVLRYLLSAEGTQGLRMRSYELNQTVQNQPASSHLRSARARFLNRDKCARPD